MDNHDAATLTTDTGGAIDQIALVERRTSILEYPVFPLPPSREDARLSISNQRISVSRLSASQQKRLDTAILALVEYILSVPASNE
jgi:hypothetical protein